MSPPNCGPPGSNEAAHGTPSIHAQADQKPAWDPDNPEKSEEHHPLKNDDDDEISETEVVVPPDGGWGWVIVFASFMSNLIVDGIIFSFAFFLKPVGAEFGVSEASVALVGSLMPGFYLMVGPFASALANRYGFRLVAILGSILGAAAFALSYFAQSVSYLCVSVGVLGGTGLGLIYVPAVITVGFYFEKWRALATGIAVCGSGIGAFLFAPVTSAMIDNLGWRSALLCQGAIVISCILFGILYRPLKPTKVTKVEELVDVATLQMDPEKLPQITRLKMEQALLNMTSNNSGYPRASNDVYHTISIPHKYFPDSNSKRLSVPLFTNEDKAKAAKANEQLLQNDSTVTPSIYPKIVHTQADSNTGEVTRPMYRDDIFFSASLTRLPQYTSRSSLAYNIAVTKKPTKNDVEEEKKHSCKICPEAVKRTLNRMLDFSLLRSPTFILMAVGGFFTMMGFYVPFMYLSDRAERSGLDHESAIFLVSAIGIANTVGRVLCGVLSSFPGVNALFVTNVALTVGGIATIFSGYSMGAEFQFTYTAIFGLAIACFASLRSIIVVDLLGLEKLTNAFGLLLLFQGLAASIGAPLAGAFKEATGSLNASFYLSGSLILVSAIMCYPLGYINRWETNRNARLKNQAKSAEAGRV